MVELKGKNNKENQYKSNTIKRNVMNTIGKSTNDLTILSLTRNRFGWNNRYKNPNKKFNYKKISKNSSIN